MALTLSLVLTLVFSLAASAAVATATIATDPYTNTTSRHRTAVEPDSFSYGSTIVAATQLGRFADGGASNIGFSTSTNGGATWTQGAMPGLTVYSSGSFARATDPSVAYDAAHGVWLVNSLVLSTSTGNIIGAAVVVNRSTDGGLTWGNPITVRAVTGTQDFDKNWIVCDNTAASPYYGRCYVQYDDYGSGNQLHMSYSTDGGLSWAESAVPNVGVIGGQPVVQPNGTVVVPIDNAFETTIGATVSTNGGVSYSSITTIAAIRDHTVAGNLRSGPLPSADTDGAGKVYVVWQDCRFRRGCKSNDIVMSMSTNGSTWSSVARVSIDAKNSSVDHFIPGIAVDKATSGSTAHIAITYYYYPTARCTPATCQLYVGMITSANGGASWSAPTTLAGPMTLSWLPDTTQGRMVGDYISTSFAGGNAFGLFALATAPTAGGTDCASATPNCNQFMATNVTGITPASSVAVSAAGDQPVPNAASDHAAPASAIKIR